MIILLFWIVFSVLVGYLAYVWRNRNGLEWFLLSLAISPLLGIFFCAILGEKQQQATSTPRYTGMANRTHDASAAMAGRV
jgi:hypothetical protein